MKQFDDFQNPNITKIVTPLSEELTLVEPVTKGGFGQVKARIESDLFPSPIRVVKSSIGEFYGLDAEWELPERLNTGFTSWSAMLDAIRGAFADQEKITFKSKRKPKAVSTPEPEVRNSKPSQVNEYATGDLTCREEYYPAKEKARSVLTFNSPELPGTITASRTDDTHLFSVSADFELPAALLGSFTTQKALEDVIVRHFDLA